MPAEHTRPLPPIGLLLALTGVVAALWLGATGQLDLYVHPRYFWFTMIIATLGLVAVVGSSIVAAADHSHQPNSSRWGRIGRGALLLGVALVLLTVPPATLTSATVTQRSLNASFDENVAPALLTADPSAFRISDWAALIADDAAMTRFLNRRFTMSGFVTADPQGRGDVLQLARFSVTCCTVDAQPKSVPVQSSDWAARFEVDSWLEVSGAFVSAPAADGGRQVLFKPETLTPIKQPAQPYDF